MNRSRGLTSSGASSRANATSTRSKRPSSPLYDSTVRRQRRRQRRRLVHRHEAHPQTALGEAARQVELRDVAAEEVLQVDRRDQQVDPLEGASGRRSAPAAGLSARVRVGLGGSIERPCGQRAARGQAGAEAQAPAGAPLRPARSVTACRQTIPAAAAALHAERLVSPGEGPARRSRSQAMASAERSPARPGARRGASLRSSAHRSAARGSWRTARSCRRPRSRWPASGRRSSSGPRDPPTGARRRRPEAPRWRARVPARPRGAGRSRRGGGRRSAILPVASATQATQ